MLNNQDIFKLCDNFTINIDRFNNNLVSENINISNTFFSIDTSEHTFRFKIIVLDKHRAKVMCLDSYKYLTCDQYNNSYFVDYYNDNDNSIFYYVADDINVCFFPSKNTNLILCYGNELMFKDVNNQNIDVDDQTIFIYNELDYSLIIYLHTLDNKHNYHNIKISNICDIFSKICQQFDSINNYSGLLIQLTELDIPHDFFINYLPTYLDRRLNIENMTVYKRVLNKTNIIDIDIFPDNTSIDYFGDIGNNIEHLLPSRHNMNVIWNKIINIRGDLPSNIYFNTSGIYYVNIENILKKGLSYYQNILALLSKKNNDQKIYNFIQFSLYYILYND
jgi:hypothetical protein